MTENMCVPCVDDDRRAHRRLLYERELPTAATTLVGLIQASIADPNEFMPSRIRHAAMDTRAVLDAIALVERGTCVNEVIEHV